MAKLGIGDVTMGQHDRDHFVVMSKLARGSIRGNVGSILTGYVRRKWAAEYEGILVYTAKKAGLSRDSCFQLLLDGASVEQLLGEPVPSEPDADIPEMS